MAEEQCPSYEGIDDPMAVFARIHPVCRTVLHEMLQTCQVTIYRQCVLYYTSNSTVTSQTQAMEDEGGSHVGEASAVTLNPPPMMNDSMADYLPCGYYTFEDPEVKASIFIQLYIFPIVLFIGLLCNPLATCVLYYIGVHKWSTVFYLSLLSMVDLLILLIKAGDGWYMQMTESSIGMSHKIMNLSDAMCKMFNFLFMFMKHMSPWLVVTVAIELMISTTWPRRTYVVCTMERARNVVMLLVILIFSLDVNYFWTWGLPQPEYGCSYTEEFSTEFRDLIWPLLTYIVELFLPLLLVSVCFFITAFTMISRKSRDEKSIEEELTKYFMELRTLRDFQVICLIICLVFMCLTFVKIVLNVVNFMFAKGHLVLDCDEKTRFHLSMQLIRTLDQVFTFIFYVMKVIPYFVFSSTFRKTLKDGFLCCQRAFLRLARKMTGTRRNGNKKAWKSKGSKIGGGGSSLNGGSGGGVDVDGACSQQLRPLVNSSHNSHLHRSVDPADDFPMEVNYTSEDNDGIYGNNCRGGSGEGGNSLNVAAIIENHSMDDSRTSFLGKGTDV